MSSSELICERATRTGKPVRRWLALGPEADEMLQNGTDLKPVQLTVLEELLAGSPLDSGLPVFLLL